MDALNFNSMISYYLQKTIMSGDWHRPYYCRGYILTVYYYLSSSKIVVSHLFKIDSHT